MTSDSVQDTKNYAFVPYTTEYKSWLTIHTVRTIVSRC